MSDLDVFVRALMRELIYLHNQDGINMLTPQEIVWALNKSIAKAHDLIEPHSEDSDCPCEYHPQLCYRHPNDCGCSTAQRVSKP